MRSAQLIFALTTLFLSQAVTAQGQGNGPPPPPGDVNVINDSNNPVPVTVTDQAPLREPFQESQFRLVPAGQQTGRNIFGPVPAGMRLHIEHASASAVIDNTLNLNLRCAISIVQPGTPSSIVVMRHALIVEKSPGQFADTHVASTPITLFAEAGQEVWFDCSFGPSVPGPGSQLVSAAISGFLVEL